jgi:hypothetical protein
MIQNKSTMIKSAPQGDSLGKGFEAMAKDKLLVKQ